MKNKKKNKMSKRTKVILILLISIAILVISIAVIYSDDKKEIKENPNSIKQSETMLNADRIMSDGSYQIRFSDLVSIEALEEYNNKTVTAIGYLSPITSYDGSFAYLMNLPYQTCPYCLPSDTKITNTISIFAKKNENIEFTESAIIVKGTLKLEPYTDDYGYSYNYRIIDATITKADTTELSEKIALYNKLAEKQVLTRLMDTLYWVDENVYYDEYTANGSNYDRSIVDTTNIESLISDLGEFEEAEVTILLDTANKLKLLATEINKLTSEKNYDKVLEYKEQVLELFYAVNDWMSIYEL